MEYRRHNQPGCGGCLLLLVVLALLSGGAPALFNLLGLLLYSGLFGFLLLIAAFWGFSYYIQRKVSTYEANQTETHRRFVHLLVHILVKIAQADGHFTRAELQTMLNFFQHQLRYNQEQLYWVKQLIRDAREAEESIDSLLTEFRAQFAYEPRLILLELIYQLLHTKEPVPESELELARRIARFLEISDYDQRTIEAKYRYQQRRQAETGPQATERWYAVLGLDPGADFETVKKAYRRLSMQYHPDKVRHLGEEFQRVAEEKMKEINAAYDAIKKQNG